MTPQSPWSRYNRHFVGITCHYALSGEDLSFYSNKTESVSLRKCPYDHRLINKAYLSAATVTNISQSFTYKMAANISRHRYGTHVGFRAHVKIAYRIVSEQNDVTVTLSITHLQMLGLACIRYGVCDVSRSYRWSRNTMFAGCSCVCVNNNMQFIHEDNLCSFTDILHGVQ